MYSMVKPTAGVRQTRIVCHRTYDVLGRVSESFDTAFVLSRSGRLFAGGKVRLGGVNLTSGPERYVGCCEAVVRRSASSEIGV